MTATGRGQDQLRTPSQLAEKLSHLADVVSLDDFAPTDQALAVHQKLSQELSGYREQLTADSGSRAKVVSPRLLVGHRVNQVVDPELVGVVRLVDGA